MSCPRHGNTIPVDIPGLRCDCVETVLAAVAPLRGGKWITAGFLLQIDETSRRMIEDRANAAIRDAVMAGYELGLSGGVKPKREGNQ